MVACLGLTPVSISTIVTWMPPSLFFLCSNLLPRLSLCSQPRDKRCLTGSLLFFLSYSSKTAFCPFRFPGSHRSSCCNYKERDGEQRCSEPPPTTTRGCYWRSLGQTWPSALWAHQMTQPNTHTSQFSTDKEKNIFIRSLLPISAFL